MFSLFMPDSEPDSGRVLAATVEGALLRVAAAAFPRVVGAGAAGLDVEGVGARLLPDDPVAAEASTSCLTLGTAIVLVRFFSTGASSI